jgi:uncharacterized protein (TIGR04255 family)
MTKQFNPLTDELVPEVCLSQAPLVRVLTQIRFPEVLAIEQKEFMAPFQEEIRSIYPVLRQDQTKGMVITETGIMQGKDETAWRFHDLKNEWRVSLTTTFLSLETTKYVSRKDFFDRLNIILRALDTHVRPTVVDRIGIRYVNHIVDDAFTRLHKLIRPEVLGILGTELSSSALHTMHETVFSVESTQLLARWGKIPANMTHDPSIILPNPKESWILDLDMFSTSATPFKCDEVINVAGSYAERIYAFFRWVVTDEFLEFYGGKS